MAKFRIEWSTGKKELVEQSDCTTVEQYVNCRFGRGVNLKDFGVKVTLVSDEKPAVVDEKPAVVDEKPVNKAKPTTTKK